MLAVWPAKEPPNDRWGQPCPSWLSWWWKGDPRGLPASVASVPRGLPARLHRGTC